MANNLIKRPPVPEWIPECTVIEKHLFKIEIIDDVRTELGLPYFKMRMRMLNTTRWFKKTQFDFIVPGTLRARRCKVGTVVRVKSLATLDSRVHFIHEIVEA